jgi:Cu/Ag efflux protein CusF
MKRSAAVVVGAMLLACASRAVADDNPATDEGSHESAPLQEARGKVQGVDKDHDRVTLEQSKGETVTLQVNKATTIFVDGHTATLDEIKAGTDVRASFELKQGSNQAQWIEVNRKGKAAPAREPLPEAPSPGSSSATPASRHE